MSAQLNALRAEVGIDRLSDWMVVNQLMIDRFAGATLDDQFIHVDPVRAATTPFGGTVAHGFLTLSLLPHLRTTVPWPGLPPVRMGVNYGLDRVRFVHPVRAGSRIRVASKLISIEEREPGHFHQVHEMIVEIEGQMKPALTATWLTRILV